MSSPYTGKSVNDWQSITDQLINEHPLSEEEIVQVVLKSWKDIFNSKIGSFTIGKEIFPSPQIISFFLHELVAHYLSVKHPKIYKVGVEKTEKDIHHLINPLLSVEIKGSSNKNQIFGNRSYAQPDLGNGRKNKDGYYITINFEKFTSKNTNPSILLVRFGYLEHSDWIAQTSSTGQQARLTPATYSFKLKTIYSKN